MPYSSKPLIQTSRQKWPHSNTQPCTHKTIPNDKDPKQFRIQATHSNVFSDPLMQVYERPLWGFIKTHQTYFCLICSTQKVQVLFVVRFQGNCGFMGEARWSNANFVLGKTIHAIMLDCAQAYWNVLKNIYGWCPKSTHDWPWVHMSFQWCTNFNKVT